MTSKIETCIVDNVMSEEFIAMSERYDAKVYVMTTIGWINVADEYLEYRNTNDYKVVVEG